MTLSPAEVTKIARLAKLDLKDNALESYAAQLLRVVHDIDALPPLPRETSLEISAATGARQTTAAGDTNTHQVLRSPLRSDEVSNPTGSRDAMAAAPDREGDFYRVPRVLDPDGTP